MGGYDEEPRRRGVPDANIGSHSKHRFLISAPYQTKILSFPASNYITDLVWRGMCVCSDKVHGGASSTRFRVGSSRLMLRRYAAPYLAATYALLIHSFCGTNGLSKKSGENLKQTQRKQNLNPASRDLKLNKMIRSYLFRSVKLICFHRSRGSRRSRVFLCFFLMFFCGGMDMNDVHFLELVSITTNFYT